MKKKLWLILGTALIGLLVTTAVIGVWIWETTREARYAALAEQAAQSGDLEQAAEFAGQVDADRADELRDELAYQNAEEALKSGDLDAAEAGFLALGTFRDAQSRVRECRYARAEALEQTGDDTAAADAFFALIPYADSSDRYRACCYRIAEQTLSLGNSYEAFRMFSDLIPYADAEARAVEIASALTGEADPTKAVALAKGFSEEDWQHVAEIAAAREALTSGRIAAGRAHAVFLFSDGHAEAVGDNTYGQCNIPARTDLVAAAAGCRHTVVLCSDGTVLAVGDNSYGQCDVSAWSGAASIVCSDWDTFAVRSDGTLLHCGFSELDLSGWTELRTVAACDTALIGVRSDGTLLCTRIEGRFSGGSYCDACIVTGAAFALTEEGTVRSSDPVLDVWADVLALRCSSAVLIGVCADGTLECKALMPCSDAYLNALRAESNVAEVAPAGSYTLILHRDGKLSAAGDVPKPIREFLSHEPAL